MNLDFVVMNLTGFLFYSIYNTYGYFINTEQTGRVDLNDVFFAYHALFATCVTVSQIFIYPKTNNKVHLPTVILLTLMWGTVAIYGTLTMVKIRIIYLANKNDHSRTKIRSHQLFRLL
jgi:cystinosin